MNSKKVIYSICLYLLISLFYYIEMFDCKSYLNAMMEPFCIIFGMATLYFQYKRTDI
jgi:hypothetical protein